MNKGPSVNKSVHYPKRLTPVSLPLLFLAHWQNCHFRRVLKFCFRARQNLAKVPESCQNGTYLPASTLANFTWTGLVEYGSDQLKDWQFLWSHLEKLKLYLKKKSQNLIEVHLEHIKCLVSSDSLWILNVQDFESPAVLIIRFSLCVCSVTYSHIISFHLPHLGRTLKKDLLVTGRVQCVYHYSPVTLFTLACFCTQSVLISVIIWENQLQSKFV